MLISLKRTLLIWSLSLLVLKPAFACNDADFNQFDFWLGEWKVLYANGTLAGKNSISRSLNGCAIEEHYQAVNGYEGKSLNTFDQSTQQWHQTWVDNTGLLLKLDGTRTENKMALWGKGLDPAGKVVMHRITWEKLSAATQNQEPQQPSLTQTWQVSQDQGLSWQTLFEGLYYPARPKQETTQEKTHTEGNPSEAQPSFSGR